MKKFSLVSILALISFGFLVHAAPAKPPLFSKGVRVPSVVGSKTSTGTVAVGNTNGTMATYSNGTLASNINVPASLITSGTLNYARFSPCSDGEILKTTGGSVVCAEDGGSGGAGGVSYVTNPGAEINVNGWTSYTGLSYSAIGSAGGGWGTWSRSTSDPLAGAGNFYFSKSASSQLGGGTCTDMTIPDGDSYSGMSINYRYRVTAGTFATGDLSWLIIGDPSGTPAYRQPSAHQVVNIGIPAFGQPAEFQNEGWSSIRACLFISSSTTSTFAVEFDDISIGPKNSARGPPITDWQSYTPTITGFGTPTNIQFEYARVADTIHIRGKFTGGTPSSTEARVSLPSGLSAADTSKIPAIKKCGDNAISVNAAQYRTVLCEPSVGYLTFGIQGTSNAGLTKVNGDAYLGSGEVMSLEASLPIAGWSSNVVFSESANTGSVVARISKSGTLAFATESKITGWDVVKDNTGMWDAANNRFNIKVPGDYILAQNINGSPATTATQVAGYRVNGAGSSTYIGTSAQGTNVDRFGGTAIIPNLKNGDYVEVYHYTNDVTTILSGDTNTSVSLAKIATEQQIAASDSISLRATGTSTTCNNTTPAIVFPTVSHVSHPASYNTSTGLITVPSPGKYRLFVNLLTASVAWSSTNVFIAYYSLNGGSNVEIGRTVVWDSASQAIRVNGADTIQMNTGDTLAIDAYCDVSNTLSTSGFFTLERVGN